MSLEKPDEDDLQLMSVKDVASRLAVTSWTVYQLLDQGRMESVYIGRSRKVPARSFREYVKSLKSYPEAS